MENEIKQKILLVEKRDFGFVPTEPPTELLSIKSLDKRQRDWLKQMLNNNDIAWNNTEMMDKEELVQIYWNDQDTFEKLFNDATTKFVMVS